jgi:hypothetical protein
MAAVKYPDAIVNAFQEEGGLKTLEILDPAPCTLARSKTRRKGHVANIIGLWMRLDRFKAVVTALDWMMPSQSLSSLLITDLRGSHFGEYAQNWRELIGVSNALAVIVEYKISCRRSYLLSELHTRYRTTSSYRSMREMLTL